MLDRHWSVTGADGCPFDVMTASWVEVLSAVFDAARIEPTNGFFLGLDIAHHLLGQRFPKYLKEVIFCETMPVYFATANGARSVEITETAGRLYIKGQWGISSFAKSAKWFFLRVPSGTSGFDAEHLLVLEADKVSLDKPVRLLGFSDDIHYSLSVNTSADTERLIPQHQATLSNGTSAAPAYAAPYSPLVGSITAAATAGSAAHVFDEFCVLQEFRLGPTQEQKACDDLFIQTVIGGIGAEIEMVERLNSLVGSKIDDDCRNDRQITTRVQLDYKANRATMIEACDRALNTLRGLAGMDAVIKGTKISEAFNSYQTLRAHSDNSVAKHHALLGRRLLASSDHTTLS